MSPMLFVTSNPSCSAVLPICLSASPSRGASGRRVGRPTLMTGSCCDLADPTPRKLDAPPAPVKRIIRKFRKAPRGLAESCKTAVPPSRGPHDPALRALDRDEAERASRSPFRQKISPGGKHRFARQSLVAALLFHRRRKDPCIRLAASVYTRLTAGGDTRFPLRDTVAVNSWTPRITGMNVPKGRNGPWVYSSVGRAADS